MQIEAEPGAIERRSRGRERLEQEAIETPRWIVPCVCVEDLEACVPSVNGLPRGLSQ